MERVGPGTRVMMLVIGALWSAAGAVWLYHLGPTYLFGEEASAFVFALPTGLLIGGLVLLKNAVRPDRPKSFEDEAPDAHPDLGDCVGLDSDD